MFKAIFESKTLVKLKFFVLSHLIHLGLNNNKLILIFGKIKSLYSLVISYTSKKIRTLKKSKIIRS